MELVTVAEALEAIRRSLGIAFGSVTIQWSGDAGEATLVRVMHTLKPADLRQLQLRPLSRDGGGSGA